MQDIMRSVPECVETEEEVRPGQHAHLKLRDIVKIGSGAAAPSKGASHVTRVTSESKGISHKDKLGKYSLACPQLVSKSAK